MAVRHVGHYLANVLAEIIVKQDTEAGKANAEKFKEALKKRQEKRAEIGRGDA